MGTSTKSTPAIASGVTAQCASQRLVLRRRYTFHSLWTWRQPSRWIWGLGRKFGTTSPWWHDQSATVVIRWYCRKNDDILCTPQTAFENSRKNIEWPKVRARFESISLTRWSHPTQSAAWNLGSGCHSRTVAQHQLFSVSPRCAALPRKRVALLSGCSWPFIVAMGSYEFWGSKMPSMQGRSLAKLRAMQRTGSCNIMHKDAWSIDISIGICLSTQPIPTRKETYFSSQGFLNLFNLFRFSSSVTQSPELHLGILVIGLDPRNKRTEVLHSDANRTGRSHVRSRRCYYISFMFLNHLNLSLRCSETENVAAPNEYFNNFELGIPNLKFTNLDEFGMILVSPIFATQFQEKPGSSAASGAPNVHLAIGPGNCFAQRRWDSDFSNDLFWFKNGKTPGPKGSKRPQKGMNFPCEFTEIPGNPEHLHHFTS